MVVYEKSGMGVCASKKALPSESKAEIVLEIHFARVKEVELGKEEL